MKRGRKKGYKMTDEQRELVSRNNVGCKAVETPQGRFHSIRAASRAIGMPPPLIALRCRNGTLQRKNGYDPLDSIKDYREWAFVEDAE